MATDAVYDSGKRLVGGRASSRLLEISGLQLVADHSAQFFYAKENEFKAIVDQMVQGNAVRVWNGVLGNINNAGDFEEIYIKDTRYVGAEGISSLARYIADGLNTKINTWVSRMERTPTGRWKLFKYSTYLGEYDFVIISHNGKCADKLLSSTDLSRIHNILKVNFGPVLANPSDMKKLQLCSLWVAIFAFRGAFPVPFEAAYVQSDVLSWVCNTSKKIGQASGDGPDDIHVWTFISTREFAAANKVRQTSRVTTCFFYSYASHYTSHAYLLFPVSQVPQESISPAKEEEVASTLLREFERCSGLSPGSTAPVYRRLQVRQSPRAIVITYNLAAIPYVTDSYTTVSNVTPAVGSSCAPESLHGRPGSDGRRRGGRHLWRLVPILRRWT